MIMVVSTIPSHDAPILNWIPQCRCALSGPDQTTMTTSSQSRKRVLSGMRPTGKLHLGNYVGALDNWVRMQDEYQCFFMVADWHALTTDYADTSGILENSLDVVLEWPD